MKLMKMLLIAGLLTAGLTACADYGDDGYGYGYGPYGYHGGYYRGGYWGNGYRGGYWGGGYDRDGDDD